MSVLADTKMYARFACGLRGFLRHKMTLEEAKEAVRRRFAERETNFLRLLERGVFGYRRSPYLPLFKLAQVELGDVKSMVGNKGLEGTLHALRQAGIYITFEEFKGREPIVRNGHVMHVQGRDFDNPYLSRYYRTESGGTTGAGTRVPTDLDHLADRAPLIILGHHAHGVLGAPAAIWRGVLPDGSGINQVLCAARVGNVYRKWFAPVMNHDLKRSLKYGVATRCAVVMGRLFGVPVPWPEPLSLDQGGVMALWAVETIKAHRTCMIHTSASMALRVCLAAYEASLDLTGATFWVSGEPLTPAKLWGITRTGARCFPSYFFAEAGIVGTGCGVPVGSNDLHFFRDHLVLIQYPRQVPGSEITVPAFSFTSLLPSVPKLMLNVETDDYGVIESRSCGCPLESYGFTDHLRDIHSFRKLTGEGMTLVGGEMLRILEEVLPARFGGSPLDYQLSEEEDERGFTRLSLLISPRISIVDEEAIIGVVLEALRRSSTAADIARAHWSQAKSLRVKRMEPVWTARGKLMPLYLVAHARAATAGSATSEAVGSEGVR